LWAAPARSSPFVKTHDPHIGVTVEAHEALVATLPVGTVACEPQLSAKGERLIWTEEIWRNKLDVMRKPGESYSDSILRLVEVAAAHR
jgi:hypothetical protein